MRLRTEIIIESHETIVVRSRNRGQVSVCVRCGEYINVSEDPETAQAPSSFESIGGDSSLTDALAELQKTLLAGKGSGKKKENHQQ